MCCYIMWPNMSQMQEFEQFWDNLSAEARRRQQGEIIGGFPPP